MTPAQEERIRMEFYRSLTYLDKLEQVYRFADNASSQRFSELTDIRREAKDLSYAQFIDKFGKELLEEYYHRDLFFKFMLLHSIFIQCYGIFEYTFTSWAEVLEDNTVLKRTDIKNCKSDIDKTRRYFQLTLKIAAAEPNKDWDDINKFLKIRNAIVHYNGRLKKYIPASKKFLSYYGSAVNDQTNEFMIREEKFLTDFLTLARNYLKMVINEIAPVKK